ncbi:NRPS-like enzyme [Penicillium odoratum]|uniref:NRPS-like enzyme n=1 Tax=Penicillium odoratum TaxID=1167516 RepID=UPI00254931E3|nr:NRPS-like enzyme [Penicillium odoratum]KAJ5746498.1 NRPS-like enzyme [Penicillium odoratum]
MIYEPSVEYDSIVAQNSGLGQLFHNQVLRTPDAIAVVDGLLSLTYHELHIKSLEIANELQKDHILVREEPVGIIVRHGIWGVVAQMAIIYAGGSCATMDPTLPASQIKARLQRVHAQYILVDTENSYHTDLLSSFHQVIVNTQQQLSTISEISTTLAQQTTEKPLESPLPTLTDIEHRSHIIHTSGTTSEPKAVEIVTRSILEVVYHAPFEPLRSTDVVAHVNNTTFDVALFDIWAPLLRGARIAVLPKTVLLDMPVMAERIDKLGITVMATTTALLNLAAATFPQAFSLLRMCWIGGEAANMKAVKEIFDHGPPDILINAYGPTECCVLCLAHRITIEDVNADKVSIGKPIGKTIAYICSPETGEAVADGEAGELWVAGPGVSRGYLNEAEKNSKAFVSVDMVGKDGMAIQVHMYRTGDLVRRSPVNGQIDFLGRADNQVKIRGYRIELEAVEEALRKTGQFSDVAALKVDASQDGASSLLAAYAVPVSPELVSIQQATEVLRSLLPEYMVPRIELIERMPLNSHAKIDRKQLAQYYRQRWNESKPVQPTAVSNLNFPAEEDVKANNTTRKRLEGLWDNILGSPDTSIYRDCDDFFELGGTSLQASLLISQIRAAFKCEMSLLALYDNSTLSALASTIDSAQVKALTAVRNERDIWVADTYIADHVASPVSRQVVDWRRDTEGRVFFTGATGFVGAFMLVDLLKMKEVHQIGCLVRASSPAIGLQRLKAGMEKYGLWEDHFQDKLLALPGLLEEPDLGLGAERFEEIANWASVIFHLGARVNYTQPYSLHRPANTLGTLHIMKFAITGRLKAMHYVSSISCFGPTGMFVGTRRVLEDECLMKHLDALPYDHGYAQSQWVVEQLLRRLIARGFPIAVYRPGFITGHSQTGVCNPDDFFSRLILACEQMGCYPRLPNQRKEFVPVDYVNGIILQVAKLSSSPSKGSQLLGHAYHIVPPSPDVSIDMDDTMELVGQASDTGPIINVGYQDWIEKLAAAPPLPLQPLQPMLAEIVHKGMTRWELYENMPIYDQTNVEQALATTAVQFPALDATLMGKYMHHLKMSN